MLNLKRVAVTGGLSSGKSSVCRFLKEFGAYVVSADQIVQQLYNSDKNLGKQIIDLLGPEIVVHSKIDRSKVAEKVFNQPQLLEKLEQVLHPIVYREIEKQYAQINLQHSYPLFVAEIPLLFESSGEGGFDVIVSVEAPEFQCIQRFEATSGTAAQYHLRMSRQWSPQLKSAQADLVIINNGTLEDLKKHVREIYQQIISKPLNRRQKSQ